jgi:hypothetical protein
MNKFFFVFIVAFVLIISLAQISQATGLYSKPEFRGRVIDAETKAPIEGAVVVVLYFKRPIIGGPGGPNSYVFKAKETLTDSKGEFFFPSYSSVILFTEDAGVDFIFFKPGYTSVEGRGLDTGIARTRIGLEDYLASDIIGKEAEIEVRNYEQGGTIKWKGPMGIVELKKAKTYDERRIGGPSTPTDYTSKELPLLFKAITDDRKERGLEVR